ncbi:MAG: NAD(P)-dependent oxidoreductase [Porphyromonadaceae bacterium]|nr:NAD(P)-dependent oxidoreductase [Porphyromonadaceae bacterium]
MNILITGATGFIGSNLVNRLIKENHNLFITIRENTLNPFDEDKIKSLFINSNNLDKSIKFFLENNIEGIIHLASFVQSGDHSIKDIEKLIDSNIKFGTYILEIAIQSNVKWMINTGTYWQNYGDSDYSPVNLYAATKQAFEDIAKYYYEIKDFKFCTLRLFDTYGKGDTRNKIFHLWNKISKSGEVLDMSPGNQIMDFSYIDDVIDAYLLLTDYLHNKSDIIENGSIYYLQSPERYSLKELSKIFEEVSGRKLNINWGKREYKKREVMNPICSNKVLPSFKHKVSIKEGIRKIIDI